MKNVPPDQKQTSVILRIKQVQLNAVLNELNDILRDYLNCLLEQREKSFKILKDMIEGEGEVNNSKIYLPGSWVTNFTTDMKSSIATWKEITPEAEFNDSSPFQTNLKIN